MSRNWQNRFDIQNQSTCRIFYDPPVNDRMAAWESSFFQWEIPLQMMDFPASYVSLPKCRSKKIAFTLPETNSSPLKIGQNPKGMSSPNHQFSEEFLSFREGTSSQKTKLSAEKIVGKGRHAAFESWPLL